MKKILFCLMFLGALVSCEQQNMNVSKKNVQQLDKNTALSKIQKLCNDFESVDSVRIIRNRTSDQDANWKAILEMDGHGAHIGYEVSRESFDPYVIIAVTAMSAVLFSVAEYERQKQEDSISNNFYPVIDPISPINTNWQYNIVPIFHESATMGSEVGYYHNSILSEIVTNNIPLNTSSSGANISIIEQIYEYMVGDGTSYIADMYMSQINTNNSILYEGFDAAEQSVMMSYNSTLPFLSENSRAAFTYQFIDIVVNSFFDNEEAMLCSIMTTYYSSFIWNRVIY
ncbi:MAG: hypothetical protein IJS05_00710 [Paludibacteraceae bacterium]|nr:hypothetical protein [Paludibacteraceae bacterium]